jgi:cell division protein FtsZ
MINLDCIFGIAINEQLGDAIIVTVIATGFEEPARKVAKRPQSSDSLNVGTGGLFTTPSVAAGAGVVTSVDEPANQDDSIPNFFFNR